MSQATYFYCFEGQKGKHLLRAKTDEDAIAKAAMIVIDHKRSLTLLGFDHFQREITFDNGKAYVQEELPLSGDST